jgi:hypothetical protein
MAWQAARNGLPGDTAAVSHSAQVAQFLAAHGVTPVWTGTQAVTPAGSVGYGYGGIKWISLGSLDVDQPFTLPGGTTAIGRVTLPLSPAGNGADVQVSLYTDSAGSPGTLITSWVLPASHLAQLAAPQGLGSGGPLATAASGTLRLGDSASTAWASPVTDAGSAGLASATQSGNYLIQAGGESSGGTTAASSVFTIGWNGGTAPGTVLPQPRLPVATAFGTPIATGDVLVYAGGVTNLSTFAPVASVWAAGWSPASGQVQGWSSQASLPQAVYNAAGAFDPATDTVYVIGGQASGGAYTAAVWYSQAVNGQLGAWKAGPQLPSGRQYVSAGVVSGWLVAVGGQTASAVFTTDTWLARVRGDGSLGPWQAGPPAPYATAQQNGTGYAVTSSGLVVGVTTGGQVMTLTVTSDGAGQWQAQADNIADASGLTGAFPLGDGQWQLITIDPATVSYDSLVLASVPSVSVPLPAAGLTGGGTYHVVLHQLGGSAASYVQAAADPDALAPAGQTRPAGGGSWTPLSGAFGSNYSLLMGVWDKTAQPPLLHLWQDSGTRVTSLLWSGTGSQLLGVLEATQFPSGSPATAFAPVTQVTYSGTTPAGTVQLA